MASRVRSWAATVVALVIAAGVLGLIGMRLHGHVRLQRMAAGYRDAGFPIEPAGYELPSLPADRNAAAILREGAEAVVLEAEESRLVGDLVTRPSTAWTIEERSRIEAVLDRNSAAIGRLLEAGALEASSYDIDYRLGWSARTPNLLELIQASKLLGVKARDDVRRGSIESAVATCASLGALSESLRRESILILQTVSTQPEFVLASVSQEIVADPEATAASLEGLEAALPTVTGTDELPRAVAFEGVSQAWFLQGRGRNVREESFWYLAAVAMFGDFLAARTLDAHLDAARALDGPYPDIGPGLRQAPPADRSYLGPLVSGTPPWTGGVYGRMAAGASEMNLLRLACRVREAALRTGRYPGDLGSVPGGDAPLPLTGNPAAYEVRSGGSAVLHAPGARDIWLRDLSGFEQFGTFRFELPAL